MTLSARDARSVSEGYLADALPRRWSHVKGVAARAASVGDPLGDREVLESAAWVHDIGYAPSLAMTGFHPLDGAKWLRGLGAPQRVVGLVAFHSSAASEAKAFGVAKQLADFEDERTLTRDLLWYLDMTTGPDGTVLSFKDRMTEVHERYPADHYVIRALELGMPERVAAVARAQAWLASVGLAGQV